MLLALAAAEGGVRLLSPRERPIEPAEIDLHSFFSDAEIERGARFARPQLALGFSRAAVELGALALVVRTATPVAAARRPERPALGGALAGAGLAVGLSLPALPFVGDLPPARRSRSGLSRSRGADGPAICSRAAAIEAGARGGRRRGGGGRDATLSASLVAARRRPARSRSAALLAALAPVVLDPVFNDFTPLPEGETRSDVLELARAAGVKVGEVYSVDASRRTTAANAYVAGLGPTKRVVLFDTLLDRYSRDEIRVVVAHELGHVRHRDVPRGVLYAALVAPAAALAVQQLSWELSPERGTAGALPALALAAAVVGAPIGLIGNRLSRAIERRADAYSLDADRRARRVHLVRARDRDPERRRPRAAAVAHFAAGHTPADRGADRLGGQLRGPKPQRVRSSRRLLRPARRRPEPPPYSGRFLMPSRVCHFE